MPMPAETDTTSPKHLRDKYAIVGVGETTYTRGSGITTRALGTWAVRNAIEDAGLKASDIDDLIRSASQILSGSKASPNRRRLRVFAQSESDADPSKT